MTAAIVNHETGLVVLDPVLDPAARDALWTYARSCQGTNPILAVELRRHLLAIASAADPINAYCRANTEPREPIRHE